MGVKNTRLRTLLIVSLVAFLVTSCSTSGYGYWVPPHSTATSPPTAVQIAETTAPIVEVPSTPTAPAPAVLAPAAPAPTQISAPSQPTASPATQTVNSAPILYYVQAADTLPVVAVRFGVNPSEITSPDPIPETDFLNPGQLLVIPRRLANTTSPEHLIPDSEVAYSPSAANFDIEAFVNEAGGKLSAYSEWLYTSHTTSGADLIAKVGLENSINPRLLLSLLEYQSHWVYGQPADLAEDRYPLGLIDLSEEGLFHQLVWAVNQLSIGYYAYREGRLTEIHFSDGVTARLAPDLNAGTAALQYYFAQLYSGQQWLDALNPESGLPAVHNRMFGNMWERAAMVEPLFPPGVSQPPLTLPFTRNKLWSFSGGPHGAWEHDGAYAALDFAPGSSEPGCVDSYAWVAAAASGLVVRSGNGVVVVDLDGDGSEQTGWVLLYLHIAGKGSLRAGTWVDAGDFIGHPSCEGGLSTGTHLHLARKYNGEWIPADGPLPFNLGGWIAHAGEAAYKGSLTRGEETINACTCGSFETRIMRTDDDP